MTSFLRGLPTKFALFCTVWLKKYVPFNLLLVLISFFFFCRALAVNFFSDFFFFCTHCQAASWVWSVHQSVCPPGWSALWSASCTSPVCCPALAPGRWRECGGAHTALCLHHPVAWKVAAVPLSRPHVPQTETGRQKSPVLCSCSWDSKSDTCP